LTSVLYFFNLETSNANKMKKEFVIWGIDAAKGETLENILHTIAETMDEAKYVVKILESEYGCKNCRIQVIDFSTPIDFTKTLNF